MIRDAHLARAPGLIEACRILFGGEAEAKLDEYFADRGGVGALLSVHAVMHGTTATPSDAAWPRRRARRANRLNLENRRA